MRWGGALLFAAALVHFVYRFVITYGVPPAGSPARVPVVIDLLLFTAFALHHSVFARTPVRAWIARLAPAHERSIYVWIASLLFIAVCALWQPVGGVAWSLEGPWRVEGWILQALGVVLTLRGAAVLDFRELAGITQGGPDQVRPARPLFSTAWPYGWIRHPIYLGWFLMVLPVGVMTNTRLVFALISCAYLVVAIPWEEKTLRRTSAGAYEEYSARVRWRLLPGVY